MQEKQEKRNRRHKRIRKKIKGTTKRPRLCVFRSNKHIYAQIIDDSKGKVLVSASDHELSKKEGKANKTQRAGKIGKLLSEKASKRGFKEVIFDRAGYKYHGRVKALAEGAREAGLKI